MSLSSRSNGATDGATGGATDGTTDGTTERTDRVENRENGTELAPSMSASSELESQPLLGHHNDQLLDPDDPKVSPLNLKRVKLMRVILRGITFFNCGLFVLLLLSDVVAIPGFNNRGRSFLELDLVILVIMVDIITLWFFAIPGYYERVLGYVAAVIFLIDVIVLFSVPNTRHQLGGLGTFIFLWTLGNILLNCYFDYEVERARNFQEVRYTGRVEKRRSLKELLVILFKIIGKLVVIVLAWNLSLRSWLVAFDSHEKPWGVMVPVQDGAYSVHLACFGDTSEKSKQPIILVEGGQLTSSEIFLEWIEELYQLQQIDRFCIWDRPGYAFSDSAPSPVSISLISEILSEALRKENIKGPFSLVGFDIGGLYAQMFASRNPGSVHSMLLVDSWHPDLLKKRPFSSVKKESTKDFRNVLELMNTRMGFKLWFRGIISPLGLVSNLQWFLHPRKYSSQVRIFGKAMEQLPKYIRARLQEQVTSSILSYNELMGTDIHDIPLGVISSDKMIRRSVNWGRWQRSLTKLSRNAVEWVIAKESSHFIWKSSQGKEQLQDFLLRLVRGERDYKKVSTTKGPNN